MITLKRPLVEMTTPLQAIPVEWLRYIEPKIMRGPYLPCWVWAGRHNYDGKPVMNHPVTGKLVKVQRYVAEIFWDFQPTYYVGQTCDTMNCVRPVHMVPMKKNPVGRRVTLDRLG